MPGKLNLSKAQTYKNANLFARIKSNWREHKGSHSLIKNSCLKVNFADSVHRAFKATESRLMVRRRHKELAAELGRIIHKVLVL